MDASIAFLVYDSRSGSTILSQLLARRYAGLHVTPELVFDAILDENLLPALLARQANSVVSGKHLQRLLDSGGLRNLDATREEILSIIANGSVSVGTAIKALLRMHVANRQRAERDGRVDEHSSSSGCRRSSILVKNGSHLKYLTRLQQELSDETPFLFLYRDPRDVIASKCVTPRPYRPGEVMAWGGVFLAAIRWNQYAQLALKARGQGAKLLFIKYETFVNAPDDVLAQIGQFMHLPDEAAGEPVDYQVPEPERGIHQLAIQGKIVRSRLNSWHDILSRCEVIAVEFVCHDAMTRLGYLPSQQVGVPERLYCVSKAATVSMGKIIFRYVSRIVSQLFSARHDGTRAR